MIPSDFNLPCGPVLDGTADYLSVADADTLDPSSSAFTLILVMAPAWASSKALLSKGNVPTAAGYLLGTTATTNEATFVVKGATTTATLTSGAVASAFEGDPRGHVFLGSSSGTAQRFLIDNTLVDSDAVTHGSVSNAIALIVGALNGGASGFATGKVIAAAVYKRQLTATEETAAYHWLLGHPMYRMPYGPTFYIDARHRLCHNGLGTLLKDLSGNRNHATLVSSPPMQGVPWPLDELELHG
jgi:hypothetical protein